MKRKTSIFLTTLLLIIALFTGCQSSTEQNVSKEDIGVDVIFTETQIEAEIPLETESQTEFKLEEETQSQKETENFLETELQTENESETETLTENDTSKEQLETEQEENKLDENGSYTSKEDVSMYLHQYGKLPSNFITKKEAQKLGWVSKEGNLSEVAPGKSIGGDYFGNYEGLLPEEDDRDYYECDINSNGGYRGAERIVFSNDGLIYYTGDHYETFELLYGEDK